MHRGECHKEALHGRVVGDASVSLRVALHAVHEDFDAARQSTQKLHSFFISLLQTGCLILLLFCLVSVVVVVSRNFWW